VIAFVAITTVFVVEHLWLPVGLHISSNLSQALWGFPVSGNTAWQGWSVAVPVGDEIWNGGAYGPEGGSHRPR